MTPATQTPATGTTTPATGSTTGSGSGSGGNSIGQLTNEDTFLQLLVAQIQNQDPLNPTDSVQFVSQLVSFSQLEQLLNINQGVTTLANDATPPTSTTPSSPSTPSNTQN